MSYQRKWHWQTEPNPDGKLRPLKWRRLSFVRDFDARFWWWGQKTAFAAGWAKRKRCSNSTTFPKRHYFVSSSSLTSNWQMFFIDSHVIIFLTNLNNFFRSAEICARRSLRLKRTVIFTRPDAKKPLCYLRYTLLFTHNLRPDKDHICVYMGPSLRRLLSVFSLVFWLTIDLDINFALMHYTSLMMYIYRLSPLFTPYNLSQSRTTYISYLMNVSGDAQTAPCKTLLAWTFEDEPKKAIKHNKRIFTREAVFLFDDIWHFIKFVHWLLLFTRPNWTKEGMKRLKALHLCHLWV